MGFLGFGGDKKTTTTTRMGQEDQSYVRNVRQAGLDAGQIARESGPWETGLSGLGQQAIGQYGDLYGGYGQMAGYGQQAGGAFGNAMQMGLSGLGQYMNPMFNQWMQGTEPAYQQALAEAGNAARVGTTLPGQSAMQSARSGVVEGQMLGDVANQRSAQIGDMQAQMASQAANMLMGDRARMGQMGFGLAGLGMQGMGGQMDVTRNQAIMGDQERQIANNLAQDEYRRHMAGLAGQQGAFMGPMSQTQTNVEEGGGWLSDFLGAALPVAGMFMGGPAGAAAGGALSSLGGGGQQRSLANPNFNIYSGVNLNPNAGYGIFGGG